MQLVGLWATPPMPDWLDAWNIQVRWDYFEGARNQYDIAGVDARIAKAARVGKQVYLALPFWLSRLLDWTPDFHKHQIKLQIGDTVKYMPDFADPRWQEALFNAIRALGAAFKDDERVAGFWVPTGADNECYPIKNLDSGNWADLVKEQDLLDPRDYINFVNTTMAIARSAWGNKPIFLEGAPNPGAFAGLGKTARRDVLKPLIGINAGYKCNALKPDDQFAVGSGALAGIGIYEASHVYANYCAFEPYIMPGEDETRDQGRLYWALLLALHYGAQFTALQSAWWPLAQVVKPLLPQSDHWIVFRDREFEPIIFADRGMSGVDDCFGQGISLVSNQKPVFDRERWDYRRHILTVTTDALLATDLPDNDYDLHIMGPDGSVTIQTTAISGGLFTIPAGQYHRLEVLPYVLPPPPPPDLKKIAARLDDLAIFLAADTEKLCAELYAIADELDPPV